MKTFLILILLFAFCSCGSAQLDNSESEDLHPIITGAEQTTEYLPLLKGNNIAIVANQTSVIQNTHLVDSLFSLGMNIVKVFGPEHGFRGNAGAGDTINDDIDAKTGISIVSLYGKNKKPTGESMTDIDVVLFDIQDVGVRFYTYISTMSYVMEACAENTVSMIVLDRPNPHGDYVDGPVLDPDYTSFVGLHQIPVVHGMTIGEYAQMVNGEELLKDGVKCDLKVIPVKNYDHRTPYELPIAPSPNLPNQNSIVLYPSLCFFEGTIISIGRGTDFPFQVIGHPRYAIGSFTFMPEDREGVAINPKHEGEICYGYSQFGFNEIFYQSSFIREE